MKLDVVVPVYNEEAGLSRSIATLHRFLGENFPPGWRILIADNGSTDGTLEVARRLAKELSRVDYIHLDQKGRGRALRRAWLESPADVVSYMDVDLSTDLAAFPRLIEAVEKEGYHIATGSRLSRGSQVRRSLKREVLSRVYNVLIKVFFGAKFSDAQCGFKAVRREAAQKIVPLIENQNWFFDTELLILGQWLGFRIKEIPVAWREDPDSRVKIGSTAAEMLSGLWRLRFASRLPRKGEDG